MIPIPGPYDSEYQCPFFVPATHRCEVYGNRPLDCRLYPYALMLDPGESGVWLGIDTKCPATENRETMHGLVASATRIWDLAMSTDFIELLKGEPRLIGPYQPDVLPLFRLEELTAGLHSANRLIPWASPKNAFLDSPVLDAGKHAASAAHSDLPRPMAMGDLPRLQARLQGSGPRLAAQSLAMQWVSRDLIRSLWCELDGFLCVWAFDSGTVYMPIPPMGPGDWRCILPYCFTFMDRHNRASEISRIENLSLSDMAQQFLEPFQIRPGYPDYVYQRADVANLEGRTYRKRRYDCRVFARNPEIVYRPYTPSDESACRGLFERWKDWRGAKTTDSPALRLLEDSRSCHIHALTEAEVLGLTGRVVTVQEEIVAYTFGFPLNRETFVVAFEATAPDYKGASAYIFREFSRELKDYKYVNLMDDSGLPGLRRLKRSYRPCRLEPAFTLCRK